MPGRSAAGNARCPGKPRSCRRRSAGPPGGWPGAAPERFLARQGVAAQVASTLLATVGDNPARLRTEASFAALCGASPVDASSGKQIRHRLNRGGDRQANSALWRIVLVRMSHDPRTKAYVARRTGEGKTSKEIIRCLKRYVAREVYKALTRQDRTPVVEIAARKATA
jgi:transposase